MSLKYGPIQITLHNGAYNLNNIHITVAYLHEVPVSVCNSIDAAISQLNIRYKNYLTDMRFKTSFWGKNSVLIDNEEIKVLQINIYDELAQLMGKYVRLNRYTNGVRPGMGPAHIDTKGDPITNNILNNNSFTGIIQFLH